jgi:hypothetical protein
MTGGTPPLSPNRTFLPRQPTHRDRKFLYRVKTLVKNNNFFFSHRRRWEIELALPLSSP